MDLIDQYPNKQGLYGSSIKKGSCGIGFIGDVNGVKSLKMASKAIADDRKGAQSIGVYLNAL